jgi:hypothetical protein
LCKTLPTSTNGPFEIENGVGIGARAISFSGGGINARVHASSVEDVASSESLKKIRIIVPKKREGRGGQWERR